MSESKVSVTCHLARWFRYHIVDQDTGEVLSKHRNITLARLWLKAYKLGTESNAPTHSVRQPRPALCLAPTEDRGAPIMTDYGEVLSKHRNIALAQRHVEDIDRKVAEAQRHVEDIDRKVAKLRVERDAMTHLIERCHGGLT